MAGHVHPSAAALAPWEASTDPPYESRFASG
jgi:hypothetical protein